MKYVVWNSCNSDLICCDSRASAEELILSIAEEEASSLNTNDNVSDLFGMNIAMPEDSVQAPIENNVTDIQNNITTPSITMPGIEKEAAISSESSSFSTPSFDFGGESYSDYDEPAWF